MSNDAARPGGEPLSTALDGFQNAYVRRLPHEHRANVSEEALDAEIRFVFDFADAKGNEPVSVRVFNPDSVGDGQAARGTLIDIVVDDSPFLVDSVTGAIDAAGYSVAMDHHLVVGAVRDVNGRLIDVRHGRSSEHRESVQHYVLDRRLNDRAAQDLETAIRSVLRDVRMAVADFEPMQAAIDRMIEVARNGGARYSATTISEAVGLLEWLRDLNFVFLGFREYAIIDTPAGRSLTVVPPGLGILCNDERSRFSKPVPLADLPPDLQLRYAEGFLLVVAKTNRFSTVHRRARMDYVGVRHIGPDGSVVGEVRMLGLFTSRALMTESAGIPILRRKLQEILDTEDLITGSHDHKAFIQMFNSFPKDELFSMSVTDIRDSIQGLLTMERRERVRLFVNPDLLRRSVSVMVVLPRDRFNAALRIRLQDLFLERFAGSAVDYRLALGEAGPARIHFTVWVAGGHVPDVPFDELQHEVIELSRTWEDRLTERLGDRSEDPAELVRHWSSRLPDYYKTSTGLEIAAGDVLALNALTAGDRPLSVGIQNEPSATGELTRIAVYGRYEAVELSTILPVLEALGLRVVEEVPTRLQGEGDPIFIHDFGVTNAAGGQLDLAACGDRVAATVAAVLDGVAESDSLDRLIVSSALRYEQVHILRAYRTYARRVNPAFTVAYVNDAFATHPHIAEKLIALFEARFDPSPDAPGTDAITADILAALDVVSSLDEDRILRGFLELITATMRTSAYRPGCASLAFKFRSADVPGMPAPRPLFEIFVYAPDVEGIHLRGGMVARGGIRWSDRKEDYRSEVLGLMKAQMTKNSVIVPSGAKGGFVLRRPTGGDVRDSVRSAYITFIRGLLDLTDNLVDGQIVQPPDVRCHDGDDPYLVVAADRGTAPLSDTANALAEEYGFWLGDAFASGGSAGYDHKVLGITARGAWESVKRHFRDLGRDAQAQSITTVGIGDMSGDVLGNGLLQSDRIRLVAAFDHRHIFLDPDPDEAAGFGERRRLFDLPRSSWDDYDRDLISSGGGVFPRDLKQIDLSPEAREALKIDAESLTPDELIRAVLMAPVDLIWNGGIGTYVKASWESHADSHDRTNDGVRVDGAEVRSLMVAEGGNLGLTQQGRIEYAMAGGRINTDFIDNSGGVDCSDREVNLKILLAAAEQRGLLEHHERPAFIAAVTEDVVQRVLYDNFEQVQILSHEVERSATQLESYEDLMRTLEAGGLLRRELEGLPNTERLGERARSGRGLTRPELAVLLAYAKQHLKSALHASSLLDGADVHDALYGYFPEAAAHRFADVLVEHPLRREILATVLANRVVNDLGITFVNRLMIETGATCEEVVFAYRVAHRMVRAQERWGAIEQLDSGLNPTARRSLLDAIDGLVEAITRWLLARPGYVPSAEDIPALSKSFKELEESLPAIGPLQWRQRRDRQVERLVADGVPLEIASRHVFHEELEHGPDIIELAAQSGRAVADIANLFLLVGTRYHLDSLEEQARSLAATTRWQRWAIRSLESDLAALRSHLAGQVLSSTDENDPTAALEAYGAARAERHVRLDQFMQMIAHEGDTDLDSLVVAVRQIRTLAG